MRRFSKQNTQQTTLQFNNMDKRELFENACRHCQIDARLDIENYPGAPAFPLYEIVRSRALDLIAASRSTVKHLPRIHFDFIDSPCVNAFAFKHDGEYFIGITAGAVLMIYLILNRILASQKTFPQVGDPTKEIGDKLQFTWEIPDVEVLFNEGARPLPIRDHKRKYFSLHLADQATMFLVGHEIAHIARGHVDYAIEKYDNATWAELGWAGNEPTCIERQAMEVDADRRSVYSRCDSILTTAKSQANNRLAWSSKPVIVDELLSNWAFSVNILFRLFGDRTYTKHDLEFQSYPPFPIRRRLALEYGRLMLLDVLGEKHRDMITQCVLQSVYAAEGCFDAIGAPSSFGGFEEAIDEESSNHITKIHGCWETLSRELMPFAYESL